MDGLMAEKGKMSIKERDEERSFILQKKNDFCTSSKDAILAYLHQHGEFYS